MANNIRHRPYRATKLDFCIAQLKARPELMQLSGRMLETICLMDGKRITHKSWNAAKNTVKAQSPVQIRGTMVRVRCADGKTVELRGLPPEWIKQVRAMAKRKGWME